MSRILAVANQKGGVAKTTTAVNLAAALHHAGRAVLLVDLDPQGNATVGSGIDRMALQTSLYNALLDPALAAAAVVRRSGRYDVLPAHPDLAGAQVELLEVRDRYVRLQRVLAQCGGDYAYVLIDCPPALNILTVNALVAAGGVLIPVQCEYYSLEGLSALTTTVERVRESLNPALHIYGLVRTMYDARNTLGREVAEQLRKHFGGKLFKTIIPRNVRLAEAPGHGLSILEYDPRSAGAETYLALAEELLRRDDAQR